MKRNYLVLMVIGLVFGLTFFGCKKDPQETLTPKITDDNVEVTATTATFTWTVDWPGKKISVVEVSENEDMSQAVRFGSEEELNKNTFLVTATDLKPATKYYYHFLVWNHSYVGNEFVLETKWFTTDSDLPKVTTLPVSEVTWTTALGGGNVADDCGSEVTERGICWSERPQPTLSDGHKANGSGTGIFSVLMEDLEPNKTYYVRAYAINENGVSYGEDESFITNETLLPEVTTAEVTDIAWRTAVGGGEVTNENGSEVTERGICWSTEHNPEISNHNANNGSGLGSFSVNMTGLSAGTTYYVRAYATNSAGTNYGNEVTFKTDDPLPPTVSVTGTNSITWTSAKVSCKVAVTDGTSVYERGLCWSTSTNPNYWGHHNQSGSGSGTFTVTLSNLTPGTTYYVRAYARSNVEDLTYSDMLSFNTKDLEVPTVTTNDVSNISQRSAQGYGKVTSDGGSEVIEKGFCWGTNPNPDFNANHVVSSSTGSSFNATMQGLEVETTYHVRAYAKNAQGTGWGEDKIFTTLPIQEPSVSIVNYGAGSYSILLDCVNSDGGDEVIERGVCWTTNPSHLPNIDEDDKLSCDAGTGTYSIRIENLEPNTSYYVRAYAKNNINVGYSYRYTIRTYPYYYNTFIGTNWLYSFVENGQHYEIWFYVFYDSDYRLSYEVYVNDEDLMWAEGPYSVEGMTIFADYDEVVVLNESGTYHGFVDDMPVSVSYQVISCDANELVVHESLENKTIHFYPARNNHPRHSKGKK